MAMLRLFNSSISMDIWIIKVRVIICNGLGLLYGPPFVCFRPGHIIIAIIHYET
jgi:hypothetical protein